jgi:predicted  nucleic acid-binding Zn-ribbon protein
MADAFVDTIRVRGSNATHMQLYFNPQQYYVIDKNGAKEHIISTVQEHGAYKINVINLDNQKSDVITIKIDDQRNKPILSKNPMPAPE